MIQLDYGDALRFYKTWPAPDLIMADGPYGVAGYDGDPKSADGLGDWYAPHVEAWTRKATPETVLFFWNCELGWAETHHVLRDFGWVYRQTNIWDKGIAFAAGNTNTKVIRMFPVVSEVCVFYCRPGAEDGRRFRFRCPAGVTNVWHVNQLRGPERVKRGDGSGLSAHPNQKPVTMLKAIIRATTNPGGTVWEPFGGLCSTAAACYWLKRDCYAAEIDRKTYKLARRRLFAGPGGKLFTPKED